MECVLTQSVPMRRRVAQHNPQRCKLKLKLKKKAGAAVVPGPVGQPASIQTRQLTTMRGVLASRCCAVRQCNTGPMMYSSSQRCCHRGGTWLDYTQTYMEIFMQRDRIRIRIRSHQIALFQNWRPRILSAMLTQLVGLSAPSRHVAHSHAHALAAMPCHDGTSSAAKRLRVGM